jgi:hypothetical protein
MVQFAIRIPASPPGARPIELVTAVTATKSLRRLLAGSAVVAVVTVVAAAPALAHPPDPCIKPGPAIAVSRA